MILLTQETGFLKPIAWVLGQIFNLLFKFVYAIDGLFGGVGLPIIGICVILFTIIVKLAMMPLTIKQQKFSKLSNMMNPEIQAIQAKYKDKKDNESMLKMQAETKAVYEKYGTSPTGGCLTMLIQLPIMFGLYRVIYKIPGYVSHIGNMCREMANSLIGTGSVDEVAKKFVEIGLVQKEASVNSVDKIVDTMYTFSSSQWDKIYANFEGFSGSFSGSVDKLLSMTNFFGINLTQNPGWRISWALLIPILAGVTQWISTKLMENKNKVQTSGNEQQQGMAGSLKVMNTIMPIMSVFFCITFPACIGVYWITSSVVQSVQQLIINKQMEKVDVEEMVQKNIEKVNAKRAKKGLPPKKIVNSATTYAEQVKKQEERDARLGERQEEIKKSTEYYKSSAKPGSLAAKANMVKMYNEKNNKKDE